MMFQQAKPIWLDGKLPKFNVSAIFSADFDSAGGPASVRIAAADFYKCYCNGRFVGYGPARAAKNIFRVDELDLSSFVRPGKNTLTAVVQNSRVNCFSHCDNEGFLTAELQSEGALAAWTGRDFYGALCPNRVNRVLRYSFQRAFSEVYCLSPEDGELLLGKFAPESLVVLEEKRYKPRSTSYCRYDKITGRTVSYGTMSQVNFVDAEFDPKPAFLEPSLCVKAYKRAELACDLVRETELLISMSFYEEELKGTLRLSEFEIFDLGKNASGFLSLSFEAEEESEVYLFFDETLTDRDVNAFRLSCVNVVKLTAAPGRYDFESFEPYGLRFVKVYCARGKIRVFRAGLVEVANPDADRLQFECGDEGLNRIFEAVKQTFRYNTVDLFMDCPSRERAGWLCDSWFSAEAERLFTGENRVEHDFLENFIDANGTQLHRGMVPMCYPAEHPDHNFIPNWAMFYLLELERYFQRTPEETGMRTAAQAQTLKLLAYFKRCENEFGLLENLPGWVFIEWSRAAEFTAGVNFPTNMLYAASLEAAGKFLGDDKLVTRAAALRKKIDELSFNGTFYVDNATRNEGALERTKNISEVCQYYAFYFGVADQESRAPLLKTLAGEFGSRRRGKHADVCQANAFIGNYLRLEVLSRAGLREQVAEELGDFFGYMCEQTGTLWENAEPSASLSHGFAAFAVQWLIRDVAGIGEDGSFRPLPGIGRLRCRVPTGSAESIVAEFDEAAGVCRLERLNSLEKR